MTSQFVFAKETLEAIAMKITNEKRRNILLILRK